MISAEEMQAIVGPMREYVDAKIAEMASKTEMDKQDTALWLNDLDMRTRACEEKLQHPALVLDYRAWVIEVAVGLGVTAKELVDAKKKLREAEGETGDGDGDE